MAYDEISDAGKGVDRPKGLVKQAIWGLAFAVFGLCGFVVRLLVVMNNNANQCTLTIQKIYDDAASEKEKLRIEANQELKERINRLENVEDRVDRLSKPKKEK